MQDIDTLYAVLVHTPYGTDKYKELFEKIQELEDRQIAKSLPSTS